MKLKKLGVWSVARISALFGVIYGLIAGILISIAIASGASGNPAFALIGNKGYATIVILPIIYGIGYLIAGALTAWIYNLLANWIGGIEIELSKK